jgi:CBS domain-containing protein
MNIGKICSRDPVSVPISATLSDVAELMRTRHVGAVVVTKAPLDEAVPVGIITDRDIVRSQLAATADLSRLSAGDAMTRDPLVLSEQTPASDAISALRARGVRRAPVVSEHGSLVGMISTDDLVAQVALDLIGVAGLLAAQPTAEKAPPRPM